jgi:predicted regulator of Ras-like GTPase activity (Roadblock/LC7/MglB family)
MATLPQLIEEDMRRLDETLREFVAQADATVALLIDKGGFVITHQGEPGELDLTTIGALSSGAYLASQTIAGLVNEKNFNHTSQQGEHASLFTINVDEHCLLVVIFPSQTGLGIVTYYAADAVRRMALQLAVARDRDPGGGFDLSAMNVTDPQELFRKKAV